MFCGTSEPTYINVGDETVLQKSCVIATPLRNAIKKQRGAGTFGSNGMTTPRKAQPNGTNSQKSPIRDPVQSNVGFVGVVFFSLSLFYFLKWRGLQTSALGECFTMFT